MGKYGFEGDLVDLFVGHRGHVVHKWHHYIPLYDRYVGRFRGTPVRFLEIGVSNGGSLQLWRNYLGPKAIIFGIDVNPTCANCDGIAGRVRIGSQIDVEFLSDVVREMGGIDVVLDDGSHHMDHIPVTLRHLFPMLGDGGVYMIEDLHTAYWKSWGGGYGRRTNFFRVLNDFVDGMHHWYHDRPAACRSVTDFCTGIHVHDSFVVLDKSRAHRPSHSMQG